jgi:hypothetical protein
VGLEGTLRICCIAICNRSPGFDPFMESMDWCWRCNCHSYSHYAMAVHELTLLDRIISLSIRFGVTGALIRRRI